MNELHRFLREHRCWYAAGGDDPRRDVAGRLEHVERHELASKRHALLQLSKLVALQAIAQLRLTCEDQRQELLCRRFDVGEQPDLFEKTHAQTLRLIHNERGDLTPLAALAEHRAEALQEHRFRDRRLRSKIEFDRERPDEVLGTENGIVDVDAAHVAASVGIERRLNQRRFAGAGLAQQERERLR